MRNYEPNRFRAGITMLRKLTFPAAQDDPSNPDCLFTATVGTSISSHKPLRRLRWVSGQQYVVYLWNPRIGIGASPLIDSETNEILIQE